LLPDPKVARGDNALAQNNKTPVGRLAHISPVSGLCPFQLVTFARSNMPDQPVSLAGKARAKADQTTDDVTKQLLLRIAETYERVADRVGQRSFDADNSK
jgi:hypothetical protein